MIYRILNSTWYRAQAGRGPMFDSFPHLISSQFIMDTKTNLCLKAGRHDPFFYPKNGLSSEVECQNIVQDSVGHSSNTLRLYTSWLLNMVLEQQEFKKNKQIKNLTILMTCPQENNQILRPLNNSAGSSVLQNPSDTYYIFFENQNSVRLTIHKLNVQNFL